MPHTRGTVRLRVSGYKAAPACQRLHVSSELQEALQEAQEEALPEELQEAQSEAPALRRPRLSAAVAPHRCVGKPLESTRAWCGRMLCYDHAGLLRAALLDGAWDTSSVARDSARSENWAPGAGTAVCRMERCHLHITPVCACVRTAQRGGLCCLL